MKLELHLFFLAMMIKKVAKLLIFRCVNMRKNKNLS